MLSELERVLDWRLLRSIHPGFTKTGRLDKTFRTQRRGAKTFYFPNNLPFALAKNRSTPPSVSRCRYLDASGSGLACSPA
jgi:hypothetical protein